MNQLSLRRWWWWEGRGDTVDLYISCNYTFHSTLIRYVLTVLHKKDVQRSEARWAFLWLEWRSRHLKLHLIWFIGAHQWDSASTDRLHTILHSCWKIVSCSYWRLSSFPQSCEILSVSVRDRCAFLKARLLFPLVVLYHAVMDSEAAVSGP